MMEDMYINTLVSCRPDDSFHRGQFRSLTFISYPPLLYSGVIGVVNTKDVLIDYDSDYNEIAASYLNYYPLHSTVYQGGRPG